ncbi:adenine nucleotide alpha hydrolase [Wenzhouxiangella sp. AB-CW3]|uniref:adenine nucleotide alpha hydrolase n=1 Tax=Wenzhouxiangella sp. AB-CW3 TaxID=2771012 RepID=UPI00168AED67|nr:adenine nucleotide alpha hydrolase [Wenzhouxiangella sp. AB-CW3]QOC22358.1 adenine nucleotide alpha hydrolase [Wenzhouxiangella sp. AB-CW3]
MSIPTDNPEADSPHSVVVLSSGGKDSLFMFHRLNSDPRWRIEAMLTTVNERNGRVAMHGTPGSLLRAQADALGIPLVTVGLPEDCNNAEYERRLSRGLAPFRERGIAHVACGDLFLADIRQWREALFERLGWTPLFPIWQEPTDRLARKLVEDGWQLTISCIDTHHLPDHFLGCRFDQSFLDALPPGIDPCGENGEFHTFVHGGPPFRHSLHFSTGRVVVTHNRFAMLELLPVDQ